MHAKQCEVARHKEAHVQRGRRQETIVLNASGTAMLLSEVQGIQATTHKNLTLTVHCIPGVRGWRSFKGRNSASRAPDCCTRRSVGSVHSAGR